MCMYIHCGACKMYGVKYGVCMGEGGKEEIEDEEEKAYVRFMKIGDEMDLT